MENLTVLVTDDHEIFRDGMVNVLKQIPEVTNILHAGNGLQALDILNKEKVHIVILDLQMPVMDGRQTISEMRIHFPDVAIIALTVFDDIKNILDMYENNVNGYLLKNTDLKEVKRCIQLVMDNEVYYTPSVAEILHQHLLGKSQQSGTSNTPKLTDRETQILKCICEQLSSEEIAEKLLLSKEYIRHCRSALIQKTGCRNSVGLAVFAIRHEIFSVS